MNCPHFSLCPGCQHQQHLDAIPLVSEAKKYYQTHGIDATVRFFGAREWRTRAKLAIRGSSEAPKIGLFEAHSHNVVAIPNCQVHHPSINRAAAVVADWIKQHKIEPYDEITHRGVIRYIQCTVERSSGKIQLAVVCSTAISESVMKELWKTEPQWQSIWININTRKDNVIFGEEWRLVFGDEWL